MNNTAFQRFIGFVELDQKIDQLAKEQNDLDKRIASLNESIAAVKKETETAHQKVHDLRKQIDAIELESKVFDEKLTEKKRKLANAHSPKEFFSLEHEIQDIENKRARLDEQGIVVLSALEDAQKFYDSLKTDEPAKIQEKQKTLNELIDRQTYVQKMSQAYGDQRKKDVAQVPEEFMARYESMKARVPNPVVPIIKGSCSACFYAVSAADIIEAQRSHLATCKDCYRMLYTHQPEKQDESYAE